ncbi:hypothetical protein [Streptomyces goshikiensis]
MDHLAGLDRIKDVHLTFGHVRVAMLRNARVQAGGVGGPAAGRKVSVVRFTAPGLLAIKWHALRQLLAGELLTLAVAESAASGKAACSVW